MRTFKVIIQGNKYPSEYYVQASGWSTGVARAIKEWQKKKGKGTHTDKLRIVAVKGSAILKED